jgi:hypothetical protein
MHHHFALSVQQRALSKRTALPYYCLVSVSCCAGTTVTLVPAQQQTLTRQFAVFALSVQQRALSSRTTPSVQQRILTARRYPYSCGRLLGTQHYPYSCGPYTVRCPNCMHCTSLKYRLCSACYTAFQSLPSKSKLHIRHPLHVTDLR